MADSDRTVLDAFFAELWAHKAKVPEMTFVERVEWALQTAHEGMCGLGAGPEQMALVHGMVLAFHAIGLLDAVLMRNWLRRLDECPGHPPSSGWCAFCGDVCRYCGKKDPCGDPECGERSAEDDRMNPHPGAARHLGAGG